MSIEVVDYDHDGACRIYRVNGRVAQIILWLVRNELRVTGPRKVRIVFNCAGLGVVRAELTEVDELGE